MNEGQARAIDAIAGLKGKVRLRLYDAVRAAHPAAVSRDQAAAAAGVSRGLAAFHLDRMAAEGLLEIGRHRLTGRSGPGAGRPAKLYRISDADVEVSLPPRNYRLAAEVLVEAVGAAQLTAPVLEAARRVGGRLGERAKDERGLLSELEAAGYEPVMASGEVRLRNCPFEALTRVDRATVCALNQALLEGAVGTARVRRRAIARPEPGQCCVALVRA